MNKTSSNNPILRKVFSWAVQILLMVLVYIAASWYQQRNMLEAGTTNSNLNLTLPTIDDNVVSLDFTAKNGDNRKTLIYFFAPWCTVCHYSIDAVQALREDISIDKLDIYVIALDWRNKQEIQEFLARHQLDVPILLGTRQVSDNYQITAYPSYYLIDENGAEVSKDMGFTTQLGLKLRLLLN